MEYIGDTSKVRIELICMRSFGTGNTHAKVGASPAKMLIPLPFAFGATPPPTPVEFGAPLACPNFYPKKETWVVAQMIKIDASDTDRVCHTSVG